ncbi:MAG: FHA domain-containing protein [Archangium sp.]|nr:FHA domain-containing protein [Archangium sp.]MDP3153184.1 FHA domain-containing protein [Archangium sp.]MDP3570218.1 FHA domain-containing protein [Archangium sp.]
MGAANSTKLWHRSASRMWQLLINGPGYFDTAYDLPEGVTQVGRADENDVVLSGDLVSRKHCRVHAKDGSVVFEDLGSRNGTKLNGNPVVGSVDLKSGDVVGIGENSLALRKMANSEAFETDMVDTGGGGKVKRFGQGVDINEAVMLARDIKESSVLRALDNFAPFDIAPPPIGPGASDTDENEGGADGAASKTAHPSESGEGGGKVAVQSLVLLYRVAECLARAPSLQEFLDETCDLVMKRVSATTGVVLLKHASGVMVPSAVRHQHKLARGEVPVSDAILEAALSKGQAIAVANVLDDSRFADRDSVVLYGIDQVLCIPIGTRAPFTGVLYLNRTRADQEPVEALLDVCTAITQLLETGVAKFQESPGSARVDRLKLGLERLYAPEVAERRAVELRAAGKVSQVSEINGTVLHAELCGLAAAAAKLPAERLAELVAEWQRIAAQLLMSFEGAIDVVAGDTVRAVFGVPYPKGDDAIRAVRAAMTLRSEWERLSLKRGGKDRFSVRAGLTTGRVFAGAVGTEARLDPVLLGDPVVVAGLLCASGEPGQVLLTGKSLAHVGARFDVTPLGERLLVGQKTKVAVFEVLDEDSDSGTLSGIR